MPSFKVLAVACHLVAFSLPSIAGVAFDTLGPDDAFLPISGALVGQSGNGSNFSQASSFAAGLSGVLSGASVAFTNITASTYTVRLNLYADDAGRPGEVLASGDLAVPGIADGASAIYSPALDAAPSLLAGSTYWLALQPVGTVVGLWNANASGLSGGIANLGDSRFPANEWQTETGTLGAFRIEVSPVPEPGTAVMALAGLVLLMSARQARRQLGNG